MLRTLMIPAAVALGLASPSHAWFDRSLELEVIGRHHSTIFDEGGAEIAAYHPGTQRVFVVNAKDARVDVLDLRDPTDPRKVGAIALGDLGPGVNSVAVNEQGLVAVAVEADSKQAPGVVAFHRADDLSRVATATVGSLPDALIFTPDGATVLVANEGEPSDDYSVDPEGSISIIDVGDGFSVRTADFTRFIGHEDTLRARGIRIFGPGAHAAQDLEPEYIAVAPDGRSAWVTLQENNAVAEVDIRRATIRRLLPLGTQDHEAVGNELDPSNRDAGIAIGRWPVHGLLQPDAIDSFGSGRRVFYVTANEGDSRDYDGFSEEARVKDLALDPVTFPDPSIQNDEQLGRLKITTALGSNDAGEHSQLFSYGSRSISIWNSRGRRIFDSGSQLARAIAAARPEGFNATNDDNDSFDARSDDKGSEPEGVVVGRVWGRTYAFVGLERVGGIAVFDVTEPARARFETYLNPRDFGVDVCLRRDKAGDCKTGPGQAHPGAGDLGPEGLVFIPWHQSPTWRPLLVVANEVSGTTTVLQIRIRHR